MHPRLLKIQHDLVILKIEGSWDESYWRSNKAYYVANKNAESHDTIVRRLRSIPRKHHSSLKPVHFGQRPATNTGVVSGLRMAPSMGLEIVVTLQGRTLSRAYNFKRLQIVSNSRGSGDGGGDSVMPACCKCMPACYTPPAHLQCILFYTL